MEDLTKMTEDDLLFTIQRAQRIYLNRYALPLLQGETTVTDMLPNDKVFHSTDMSETLIVGPNYVISVDDEGNTTSVERAEWSTGWTC